MTAVAGPLGLAQALPEASATIEPAGGIAVAAPEAQAFVGPGGIALSRPVATGHAGVGGVAIAAAQSVAIVRGESDEPETYIKVYRVIP